jgi:hypothetical protein
MWTWDAKDKNGCGPWWVPRELKNRYYESQCNIHDKDYAEGVDRSEADKKFYHSMLKRANGEKKPFVRLGRTLQAILFFHIVRRFGWTSHKGASS